jgi:hypothetical protein
VTSLTDERIAELQKALDTWCLPLLTGPELRELLAERAAAKRLREAMRECDGITSRDGDLHAIVVSFRNRDAADQFLKAISG